jgi:large subunit ribosomal protein L25
MDIIELKADARSMTGKKGAKACRNSGQLPGVLYGMGSECKTLAVNPKQLEKVLQTEAGSNVIIKLSLAGEGDPVNVIVKELQVDNIKGLMRHVDFYKISLDEKIKSAVQFKMVGESPGVKAGGILEHILWELEIECLPMDIPDHVEADISELEIGDSISVSQVSVPEGVSVLADPNAKIVLVAAPRVEEVEEVEEEIEGEEGEEPEVISEGGKEEAAEGDADKAGDSKEKK